MPFYGVPGKSRQERLNEIEKYINANPTKPYLYNNPRHKKSMIYLTEPVLKSLVSDAGFSDIAACPFNNKDYPNGLNDYQFPENIELMAKKP